MHPLSIGTTARLGVLTCATLALLAPTSVSQQSKAVPSLSAKLVDHRASPRGIRVRTDFDSSRVHFPTDELRFTVTVSSRGSDSVSLALRNPPPGLIFEPVRLGQPPFEREVSWLLSDYVGGLNRLEFVAYDDSTPQSRTEHVVEVQVGGNIKPRGMITGDLTGDGRLDLVAMATAVDVAGLATVGVIYLWDGETTPVGTPTAIFAPPTPKTYTAMGSYGGQGLLTVDVNGDGLLDMLAYSGVAKSVYIWFGGPDIASHIQPDAILSAPGVGFSTGKQDLLFADVTGDGVRDILVATNVPSGRSNVHVWAGGGALAGSPTPTASLHMSFSIAGGGQPFLLADWTGDGILDLVTMTSGARINGVQGVGAIYVWEGGPTLIGDLNPMITLSVPGARAGDALGSPAVLVGEGRQTLQVGDVTGDGIDDIVAVASLADIDEFTDAGAAYVWAGRATGIPGVHGPTATLQSSEPGLYDMLGVTDNGQRIYLEDVTGDGLLDVIVPAAYADIAGNVDAGAVFVWPGGSSLGGSPAPILLTDPSPGFWNRLSLGGLKVRDLTGDGIADLLIISYGAMVGQEFRAGAIQMWKGGSLSNSTPPHATLAHTLPESYGYFGSVGSSVGVELADVTGDGIADVVVGTVSANGNAGDVHVWCGGAALSGSASPVAVLSGSGSVSRLGSLSGRAILLADVTADGVKDVVTGSRYASVYSPNDGALCMWAGGPGLVGALQPTAMLAVPTAQEDDGLGWADAAGPRKQGLQLADVTGDGALDMIVGASDADFGGIGDVGAVYVFSGGPSCTGDRIPTASLFPANPSAGDQMGHTSRLSYTQATGHSVQLLDITGDGVVDILAAGTDIDFNGVSDSGAILGWRGGANLQGVPAPDAVHHSPTASVEDRLGG